MDEKELDVGFESAASSRGVRRCNRDEKELDVVGNKTLSSRRGGNVRIRVAVQLKRRAPESAHPLSASEVAPSQQRVMIISAVSHRP